MPLAVTLRLDDETAFAVERIWRSLAEQTGDDDALRLGYAPHLTLAVLPNTTEAANIQKAVFNLTDNWDALPLTFAGFGVFATSPSVIWAAPVVTELLLARHASLYAALLPNPVTLHYCPGAWMPHVTLSQAVKSVAHAIEVISADWREPIRGWGDRIELVRFPPVEILCGKVLRHGMDDVLT